MVLSGLGVAVAVAANVCELENDTEYGNQSLVMLFHEYFMCLVPTKRERERVVLV